MATIAALVCLVSLHSTVCQRDPMRAPFPGGERSWNSSETDRPWSHRFYKKYISPARGTHCPMQPSCSEYARLAFQRFGFIRGFVMMADRLTRCGNDLHRYPHVRTGPIWHAYDPVASVPATGPE
jgi:putative component of membrane protein insertase Oxa1/YidC/SpoIIIJ protein YidD